jgi:hypothetical protein
VGRYREMALSREWRCREMALSRETRRIRAISKCRASRAALGEQLLHAA